MAKKTINVGTDVNTKDGDTLRAAFQKVNDNFDELYAKDESDVNLGAVSESIIPDTDVAYDLGSATNRFRDLYLSGNTIDLGGLAVSTANGKLSVGGDTIPTQADLDQALVDVVAGTVDLTPYATNADVNLALGLKADLSYVDDIQTAVNADLALKLNTADLPTIPVDISDLTDNTNLLQGVDYDQSLNTTDSPAFAGLTVDKVSISSFDTNTTLLSNVLTVGADSVGSQMSFGRNGFAVQQFQDPEGESNKLYSQLQLSGGVARLLGRIETLDNLDQPTEHFGTVNAEAGRVTVQAYTGGTAVEWMFDESGITFPDATVQTTAWTGSVGNISVNTDFTITVDTGDSSPQVWQFDTGGVLTFPNGQQVDAEDANELLIGTPNAGLILNSTTQSSRLVAKKTFDREFNSNPDYTFSATVGPPHLITVTFNTDTGLYLLPLLERLEDKLSFGSTDFRFDYSNIRMVINPYAEAIPANILMVSQASGTTWDITIDQDPTAVVGNVTDLQILYDYNNTVGLDVGEDMFGIATDNDDIDIRSGRDIDLIAADDITFRAGSTFDLTLLQNNAQAPDDGLEIITESSTLTNIWKFQFSGLLQVPGNIAGTDGIVITPANGETYAYLNLPSDANAADYGVAIGNDNGRIELRTTDQGTSNSYTWKFDNDGSLTLPGGYLKPDTTDGFLTVEGPLFADMVREEGGGVRTITNGVKIRTHRAFDDVNHDWNFSWDGAIYAPRDASNYQVGAIEWRTGNVTSQIRRTEGGTLLSGRVIPPGLMLFSNGTGAVSVLTGNSKYWTFEEDGDLTIPGGIRSDGDINIDINLSDSTLRRWRFGEDGHLNLAGNLTFPDATVQTTALKAETIAQVGYRLQFDTDIYANSTGGATSSNETGVQFASNTVVRELFDLTPPATSTAARAYVDPLATEGQPDPNILEVTIVSGAPISVGMIVFAIVNGTPTFLGPIDSQTDATTFRIMGAPLTEEIPIGTEFEFYGPGNFIEYAPISPITIFWDSGEETVVTAGSTNDPYGVNVFLVTAEDQTALTYPIEVATDNYAPAEFSHVIDADNEFKITTRANDFIINSNEGPLVFRNIGGDLVLNANGQLETPGSVTLGGQTYTSSGIIWQNGPGAIINNNSINEYFIIQTNADNIGSEQNWLFGYNGVLTLPGEGVIRSIDDTIVLKSYDSQFNSSKGIRIGTNGSVYFELGDDPAYLTLGQDTGDVKITANSNLDITSSNYVTIESTGGGQIMLGANQLVGGNNGAVVLGHSGNSVNLYGGKLRIQNTSVPTTSLGTTGDVAGLVAFDATYMYYCTQNFSSTVINMNSITSSGILRAYIIMYDSNTGWTSADLTGYTVTGPGSYTGTVTGPSQDQGGGLWYIPVSPDVTQGMGTYSFTSPAGGNIWKRVAWSGDTW